MLAKLPPKPKSTPTISTSTLFLLASFFLLTTLLPTCRACLCHLIPNYTCPPPPHCCESGQVREQNDKVTKSLTTNAQLTKFPMTESLMKGFNRFLFLAGIWSSLHLVGIQSLGIQKCYKTFYGRNDVTVGVTQSKP